MTQHFPLTLILALLPGLATAQPLTVPDGATPLGARVEDPSHYALATAAFDGTTVPSRLITGALDQRAWRLDGIKGNTLSLLQPLAAQLSALGYTTIFTCQTTECGGFDFRFALDVLPEPQMHVDLGDFQYLAAMDPAGDAVSLLVSRSADQGFVQVTTVMVAGSPAPQPASTPTIAANPAPATDIAPAAQPDVPPQPDPQPSVPATKPDFDTRLMTAGSVPLDDLIFASGKAALQDQDYASLAALAAWLTAHPGQQVTLVGHTDASGTLAGNVALSRQRAASVRDWLVQHYKAPADQIDAQGAGYLAPRASNQTPEGRTLNRRVEVMLTSLPPK